MGIIVKDTGNGDGLHIEPGRYQAVCYAVWDIGTHINPWGKTQEKIVIAWEIDQRINFPESEYHNKRLVISKFYTKSLNKKANLRADLEDWRGKDFTDTELKGFDTDNIIGANCALELKEKTKENGDCYTEISHIGVRDRQWDTMKPELDQNPPEWIEKMREKAITGGETESAEFDSPDVNSDKKFGNDPVNTEMDQASEPVEF